MGFYQRKKWAINSMNNAIDRQTAIMRTVPESLAGERIDQALSQLFPDYSRSRLQQWLKNGQIQVDGQQWRAKDKVQGGEQISLVAVQPAEEQWQAEAIPLEIVYEDDQLLVINKPAGLVVHPAVGNRAGTLLNALLHHAPELASVPRAGIVHRLDKETSGLLVVARTLQAQKSLVEQLQARAFLREYDAIVQGRLTAGGSVDAPIGRHPVDRKKMAVVKSGKPAVSHYRIKERFRAHTWLTVRLETGRTHQIRVHMAYIRHPLLGDPAYGGRLQIPRGCSEALQQQLHGFQRQALHARELGLMHPASGESMHWQADLPADMQTLVSVLRADYQASEGEP